MIVGELANHTLSRQRKYAFASGSVRAYSYAAQSTRSMRAPLAYQLSTRAGTARRGRDVDEEHADSHIKRHATVKIEDTTDRKTLTYPFVRVNDGFTSMHVLEYCCDNGHILHACIVCYRLVHSPHLVLNINRCQSEYCLSVS